MPKIFLLRQELQLQHEELRGQVKGAPVPVISPTSQDTLTPWEQLFEPHSNSDNKNAVTPQIEEKIEPLVIPEDEPETGKPLIISIIHIYPSSKMIIPSSFS